MRLARAGDFLETAQENVNINILPEQAESKQRTPKQILAGLQIVFTPLQEVYDAHIDAHISLASQFLALGLSPRRALALCRETVQGIYLFMNEQQFLTAYALAQKHTGRYKDMPWDDRNTLLDIFLCSGFIDVLCQCGEAMKQEPDADQWIVTYNDQQYVLAIQE